MAAAIINTASSSILAFAQACCCSLFVSFAYECCLICTDISNARVDHRKYHSQSICRPSARLEHICNQESVVSSSDELVTKDVDQNLMQSLAGHVEHEDACQPP